MFWDTVRTAPAPPHVEHARDDVPGSAPDRVAALAGNRDLDGHARGDPGERLLELDLEPRPGCRRPAPTGRAARPCLRGRRRRTWRRCRRSIPKSVNAGSNPPPRSPALAVAVIQRPTLGVGEHLVRLGDLAEPALRVRLARNVGMQLTRERPERLLDLGVARRRVRRRAARSSPSRVWRTSDVLVDVLDEARELERRGANRADRLLVVHAQRADETDRAERRRADPVRRADERDRVELGAGELQARRGRPAAAARAPRSRARARLRGARAARRAASSPRPPRRARPRRAPPCRPRRPRDPTSAPTSSSVCPMSARNARSRGASSGASSLRRTVLDPSRWPTSCSSRYSPAQATSPGSTGSSSRKTRFVTPPVDVMTTTITLDGCRVSTSTCRIDAVSSEGAETSASSRVASESMSVVARSACSISSRIERRSTPSSSGRPSSPSTSSSA